MSRFRHLSYETCQRLPFVSSIVAMVLSGVLLALDLVQESGSLDSVKIVYEILVVTVGFFLIFCFSWILRFCWYQLFGILYTYVFFVCLWLCRYTEGRYGIFGEKIVYLHGVLFVIGVVYVGMVMRLMKRKEME